MQKRKITAKEILKQYDAGRRDFHDVSIRGQSFKGKNLSGADFSGADIRSANFTNANLQGVKFVGAEAGLQRRWAVLLLLASWILSGFSGFILIFLSTIAASIFEDLKEYVGGWILFIIIAIFWTITIQKGTLTGLGFALISFIAAIAMAFAGTGMVSGSIAGDLDGALTGSVSIAFGIVVAGSIAVTGATTIAIAGAIAVAGTIAGAIAGSIGGILTATKNTFVPFALSKPIAFVFARSFALALTFALAATFIALSIYLSWRAMKGDPRDAWIKSIAVAFAAIGGTSFRGANLTDANFSNATLKSTDLRRANLTRTRWRNSIKLNRIRPGNSYLDNPLIRELVRTGQGQNINCDRLNLQGANLQGANLQGASFIEANLNEANLQDADLTDARLVHAQLDGADLTGATLTGAYIEEWNITTSTKLNGIRCYWVFMRLPPEKRPAFIALSSAESTDPNPRRQPSDWDKRFEDGDFTDFIAPMRDTLNLYHNQSVDPRLLAIAFQQLRENNPEAELEPVAIEKKGKNQDKLLVKAKTSPQANHAKLHSQYFTNLEYLQSLSPAEMRALLADRGAMINMLAGLIEVGQRRPNFSIENSQIGDLTMTSEQRKILIKEGEYRETTVRDNAQYAERDINHYAPEQRQTLAEAAEEIQALLDKLSETYPTDTVAGQMQAAQDAMNQIQGNMPLADRVLSAVRVGGTEALKQTLNHPAATFVLALIDDWQKTKGS